MSFITIEIYKEHALFESSPLNTPVTCFCKLHSTIKKLLITRISYLNMDLDSDTMEKLNEKMELIARKNKFKRVLLP